MERRLSARDCLRSASTTYSGIRMRMEETLLRLSRTEPKIFPVSHIVASAALAVAVAVLTASGSQANSRGIFPGTGSYDAWYKANAPYNKGLEFKKQGKFDDATKSFKQAISMYPGESTYHNGLGEALMAKKDFAGAEKSLREATRLEPQFFSAWYSLASAQYQAGKYEDAKKSLMQATGLQPPPEMVQQINMMYSTMEKHIKTPVKPIKAR